MTSPSDSGGPGMERLPCKSCGGAAVYVPDVFGDCRRCGGTGEEPIGDQPSIGSLLNRDITQTREAVEQVLNKVPDVPPTEGDEAP